MRYLVLLLLPVVITGCGTDFMGYPAAVTSTNPTKEQIEYCRKVMYINPDIKIEPKGFFLQPGMDDTIRFKFIADTDDPAKLFDPNHVDPTVFRSDFGVSALNPAATESWWDVASRTLTGGSFSVPPPDSPGTRGLNIGYAETADGELMVYVLWFET